MPPDEHSRLVLVLKQNVCIARMCGTTDMSDTAAHLNQNDCHPKGHDNVMDDWYPAKVNRVKTLNSINN